MSDRSAHSHLEGAKARNCSSQSLRSSHWRWVPTRSATKRPEALQRRSIEIDTLSTSATPLTRTNLRMLPRLERIQTG